MRTHLKLKEVDDVLGGQKAWENVDKTASELTFDLSRRSAVSEADRISCLLKMRPYACIFPTITDQISG